MLGDGMGSVYEKHVRIANDVRSGVKSLGLELFPANEQIASNTVTAVKVPEGVQLSNLRGKLRSDKNIVVAGGQGSLSGKIFRVGHMGYITDEDVTDVMSGLKSVLPEVGFTVPS